MAWNPFRAVRDFFHDFFTENVEESQPVPEDRNYDSPGGGNVDDYGGQYERPYLDQWGPEEKRLWDDQIVASFYTGDGGVVSEREYLRWQREFNDGWIRPGLSRGEHVSARNQFYRLTYSPPANFNWEAWREYMGYNANR